MVYYYIEGNHVPTFIVKFSEYQVTRNVVVHAVSKLEARNVIRTKYPAACCISCPHTIETRLQLGQDITALGYQVGDTLATIHTWS